MRKLSLLASAANGAMCLLVAVYGAFVLLLMRGAALSLPVFSALCAGLFALCLLLSRRFSVRGRNLPDEPDALSPRVFAAAGGFSLLVSLTYLWAFYPGGVSSDTVTQWLQLRGEFPLDDWHPALHTMLLWMVTCLCDHPAFVLLIQGVCYACAVGYASAVVYRWHLPKSFTVIMALYLSANPAISNIMAFPWKDCAFAVCTLFLGAQLFEIHCSQGEWLKRRLNPFLLALTLALCAILRHNGIALSLAALVWLLISCHNVRKAAAISALCACTLFALIKGPLYSAAGVQKDSTPLDETIGLPMVVLSHTYVHAPESLDAQIVAFLETLAPRDAYIEYHRPGDWNATKWYISTLPKDHGYTLAQVFSFAAKAALSEPQLALEALAGLFDQPLLPAGAAYWRMSPYVEDSAAQLGFSRSHHPFLSRALNWLCRTTAKPALSWLLWRPGVPLLLVMLFCVLFARRRPLTSLLIPAALIAYHLATCVMLSSPTDFRFFLPTLMLSPLALAALLLRPKTQAH